MTQPSDLSLTEAQSALRKGEISSRALTQAVLDRISALDGKLHSFLHVAAESALQQADAADKKLVEQRKQADHTGSSLQGLPIAVKDVFTIEGMPCTCGSKILEGWVPPFTATVVKNLKAAGVVSVARPNTDELAMG